MTTPVNPTAHLADVGTTTPLAKVLQRAMEARHHARGRTISGARWRPETRSRESLSRAASPSTPWTRAGIGR